MNRLLDVQLAASLPTTRLGMCNCIIHRLQYSTNHWMSVLRLRTVGLTFVVCTNIFAWVGIMFYCVLNMLR